jgi:hypothetical protein
MHAIRRAPHAEDVADLQGRGADAHEDLAVLDGGLRMSRRVRASRGP